jgi:SAM-dependent methyltransferase
MSTMAASGVPSRVLAMDFNETKKTYRSTINQVVGFVGQDLDFFTAVKADFLQRVVREFFPAVKRPRVLDIGCGHGLIHPLLGDYDVVGVDVATEVLSLARTANPTVRYAGYDGRTLPFQPGSFDVTMAVCVMHHVPPAQWVSFLEEMKRMLSRNGIGVIFEHNPLNPLTRYVVANNDIDADACLLRSFTLQRLLREAGFTQIATKNILFTPFGAPVFRWLDRQLWWCPFGAQYYTIASR